MSEFSLFDIVCWLAILGGLYGMFYALLMNRQDAKKKERK